MHHILQVLPTGAPFEPDDSVTARSDSPQTVTDSDWITLPTGATLPIDDERNGQSLKDLNAHPIGVTLLVRDINKMTLGPEFDDLAAIPSGATIDIGENVTRGPEFDDLTALPTGDGLTVDVDTHPPDVRDLEVLPTGANVGK